MAEELFVGIDVGGTSVKVGLVDREGTIHAKASVPTPPLVDEAGYSAVVEGIKSTAADNNVDEACIKGIGLAVPCPVPDDGNISVVANMSLNLLGVQQALKVAFPAANVVFLNDANAAALGEQWKGAAAGYRSMVLITLGTGIGAGVVIDGKVVGGANGAGGEIGHTTVNPAEKRQCGCGRFGCLEQYSSATGVVNSYLMECEEAGVKPIELTGPSDSKDVFQACREGDEVAWRAVDTMAYYLGLAISNTVLTVDPDAVVIGGGVSASADVYLEKVTESFKKFTLSCCADTPITVASLGNDAGLLGAAHSAM